MPEHYQPQTEFERVVLTLVSRAETAAVRAEEAARAAQNAAVATHACVDEMRAELRQASESVGTARREAEVCAMRAEAAEEYVRSATREARAADPTPRELPPSGMPPSSSVPPGPKG
jgi:hypothetical protein